MRPESLHIVMLARAVASLHGVGGLERHVHDLVVHLARRGARITLITQPPFADAPSSGHVRLGHLDEGRIAVRAVPYVTFPLAGRRGTTILDRNTAYLLFGWRAGRLADRLVHAGGVHLVHAHGAIALGYAQARRRDRIGTVPLVLNPHGLEEFGGTDPTQAPLKRLAYRPLQHAVRTCAAAADRIIATDRVLQPMVVGHLGVDPSRVRVVPNAVDLERVDRMATPEDAAALRRRLGLGPDDVLLLGVGRLERNKGYDVLVAALARQSFAPGPDRRGGQDARASAWRCVILGDGPDRARLERQIEAAGLGDHVQLPGRAEDRELHAWYEAATLFVHPTRYEGSSLATLEAMAHRRAVVGTTAGGLPDKVRPDVNGWLVPPNDPAALAAALETAVDASRDAPERFVAMGVASRSTVEGEFSWTAVASRLFAVYDELLADRSIASATA